VETFISKWDNRKKGQYRNDADWKKLCSGR
jgi:hypothetical protein